MRCTPARSSSRSPSGLRPDSGNRCRASTPRRRCPASGGLPSSAGTSRARAPSGPPLARRRHRAQPFDRRGLARGGRALHRGEVRAERLHGVGLRGQPLRLLRLRHVEVEEDERRVRHPSPGVPGELHRHAEVVVPLLGLELGGCDIRPLQARLAEGRLPFAEGRSARDGERLRERSPSAVRTRRRCRRAGPRPATSSAVGFGAGDAARADRTGRKREGRRTRAAPAAFARSESFIVVRPLYFTVFLGGGGGGGGGGNRGFGGRLPARCRTSSPFFCHSAAFHQRDLLRRVG